MNTPFEFLVEKEAVWADMLMQILKENNIFCKASPVYGAGLVMAAGVQERLRIYVPAKSKLQAQELMEAFFPKPSE